MMWISYFYSVFFCLNFIFIMILPHIVTSDDTSVLYTDISFANTTDSLLRVSQVTVQYYAFKYDTVAGRRQMGILGKEAEKFFPEAVEVVPTYSFPSKEKGTPPIVLQNFPIVDKNAIFMHGFAALKDLISLYNKLDEETKYIKSVSESLHKSLEDLEQKLSSELVSQQSEKMKLELAQSEHQSHKLIADAIQSEEFRKTMAFELAERKELLRRQEKLDSQSQEAELRLAQKAANESIQMEREMLEKREELNRESFTLIQNKKIAHEKELQMRKAELDIDRIRAEIASRAEADRAKEEQALRHFEMQTAIETQRMVETVRTVSRQVSNVIVDVLSQPLQVAIVLGTILSLMAAYYMVTTLTLSLRQLLQARLGRPSLIRETSVQWSVPWLAYIGRSESIETGLNRINEIFEDVILADEDRVNVIQLALSTRNTKQSGTPFRHVLLHGPPGTGKTLIARKLAVASGMDYAIMSGGDVGPLGEDAVTQLHRLFQWAARSRSGLLVFVDEAEAFLCSRGDAMGTGTGTGTGNGADAHLRHALNALLYQTGTQSRQFMLVLATNRPSDLDSAVLDRIDVSLFIGLPGREQRLSLLNQYFKRHVTDVVAASKKKSVLSWSAPVQLDIDEKCFSRDALLALANSTDGFSGREISKLTVAVQYALLLAHQKRLTYKVFDATVKGKIKEHLEKRAFLRQAS